jgi:ubiquinone/menaquinone biosynthesis C-methylase UbiE
MKRVVVPELLDTDSGTPREVQDSLADLRWINRNFGGLTTTTELLTKVAAKAAGKELSYLDVGGATGDVASAAKSRLQVRGITLTTAVLDRSASHLAVSNGAVGIAGDAFHLPFHDGAFDVVGSALFIHHLELEEIIAFVNEALRVSRQACIINDLRRSRMHLLFASAGRLLYRSPITTHDSVASVRRAYTSEELRTILARTTATSFDMSSHFLFRIGVVAWKT